MLSTALAWAVPVAAYDANATVSSSDSSSVQAAPLNWDSFGQGEVSRWPEPARAHDAKARAAFFEGDYGAAVVHLTRLQSAYPDPLAHFRLGLCYVQLQQSYAAQHHFAAYARTSSAATQHPELADWLRTSTTQGQAPPALQPRISADGQVGGAQQLERINPVYEAAIQQLNSSQFQSALETLLDLQAVHADSDFHYYIGVAYSRMGQRIPALASFDAYEATDAKEGNALAVMLTSERAQLLRPMQSDRAQESGLGLEQVAALDRGCASPRRQRGCIVAGSVMLSGGSVLAAAGGILFGVLAWNRSEEVESHLNMRRTMDTSPPWDNNTARAHGEGVLFESLQITSIVVGVSTAVAGLTLTALGRKAKRSKTILQPSALGLAWNQDGIRR